QCVDDILAFFVHRQDDESDVREFRNQLSQRLEACGTRHLDVCQHYVRLKPLIFVDKALAVFGFSGNPESLVRAQQGTDPLPDQGMVISKEKADRCHSALAGCSGIVTSITVPCPGVELSSNSPFSRRARSLILRRPYPVSSFLRSPELNPFPLSATIRWTCSGLTAR